MPSTAEDSIRSAASSPIGFDQQSSTAGGNSSTTVSHPQVMKFVKMMSLTMADQLKTVVLKSVDALVEFWNGFDVQEMSRAYFAGTVILDKPQKYKYRKCPRKLHASMHQ